MTTNFNHMYTPTITTGASTIMTTALVEALQTKAHYNAIMNDPLLALCSDGMAEYACGHIFYTEKTITNEDKSKYEDQVTSGQSDTIFKYGDSKDSEDGNLPSQSGRPIELIARKVKVTKIPAPIASEVRGLGELQTPSALTYQVMKDLMTIQSQERYNTLLGINQTPTITAWDRPVELYQMGELSYDSIIKAIRYVNRRQSDYSSPYYFKSLKQAPQHSYYPNTEYVLCIEKNLYLAYIGSDDFKEKAQYDARGTLINMLFFDKIPTMAGVQIMCIPTAKLKMKEGTVVERPAVGTTGHDVGAKREVGVRLDALEIRQTGIPLIDKNGYYSFEREYDPDQSSEISRGFLMGSGAFSQYKPDPKVGFSIDIVSKGVNFEKETYVLGSCYGACHRVSWERISDRDGEYAEIKDGSLLTMTINYPKTPPAGARDLGDLIQDGKESVLDKMNMELADLRSIIQAKDKEAKELQNDLAMVMEENKEIKKLLNQVKGK